MSDTINAKKTINLYPCKLCKKLCYSDHCTNCYYRLMAEKKNDICSDCNQKFDGIRIDGSRRKRCLKCQTKFNNEHRRTCVTCNDFFYITNSNNEKEKNFDKCKNCYEIFKKENPLPRNNISSENTNMKICIDCNDSFYFVSDDKSKVAERCKNCYNQYKKNNPLARNNRTVSF